MKNLIVIIVAVLSLNVMAQFRESTGANTNVKDGIISNNYNSTPLFGFLNSENFSMNHSFSLSHSMMGEHGISLGVYTNSMMYRFSENLNVQVDASLVHSPYSTFGQNFQDNINGLYISKAALNYQPWKDVQISVQYRQLPYNYYYMNPYGGYGNRLFGNDSMWGR
jgi:hypothetical protein